MTKKQIKIDPKITELESNVSRLESALARALADYANLERRFSEQSSAVVKFANAKILAELLGLLDDVSRAIQENPKDVLNLLLSQRINAILKQENVVEINAINEVFDPASMECQEMGEGEKNKVIKVIRPGYRLHDRVLRTARVVVGSGTHAAKGHSLTGDVAESKVGTPKAEGVSL